MENAGRANVRMGFDGTRLRADLRGEIDHHNSETLRREIDRECYRLRPRALILGLEGVSFMDSAGLGLIVGRWRVARELDCDVTVTGISPAVRKIFSLAGLERMKGLTVEGA